MPERANSDLAQFYIDVFGCRLLGPQRDHHGQWIEKLTKVPEARVRGAHLRLPGFDDRPAGQAPTLEIFEYSRVADDDADAPRINQLGLAHLAFEVDDVAEAKQAALDAGGQDYGDLVTVEVPDAGTITLIYMTDPEGNIFELQRWS